MLDMPSTLTIRILTTLQLVASLRLILAARLVPNFTLAIATMMATPTARFILAACTQPMMCRQI